MAKRPTKQQNTSWAVYHIRGTPAQFVGIVDDAADEQSAIAKAIEEYDVPQNQRGRAAGLSNHGRPTKSGMTAPQARVTPA
jgi:hypothetical protein